jgi:hypothetical protein
MTWSSLYMAGEGELLEVVEALYPVGSPRTSGRRAGEADEDGDDADHHQHSISVKAPVFRRPNLELRHGMLLLAMESTLWQLLLETGLRWHRQCELRRRQTERGGAGPVRSLAVDLSAALVSG